MDLDAPFEFEPALPSGVRRRTTSPRCDRFAEQVLALTESARVIVLDLASNEARTTLAGSGPEPTSAEEALLGLWLQEAEATTVCAVPAAVRALLPTSSALMLPVMTPAGRAGAVAVLPPCTRRRVIAQIETLALEFALELEVEERGKMSRNSRQLPARPASGNENAA